MPPRTHEQKLELKDLLRRAANDPNKSSPFRKGAFRRMLDSAKEPELDSACKIFITERVKDFFADFPEWQEEAINMVYDMCEDQDQQVRIEGHRALGKISKSDKKWLIRNTDVLVQLLQSDDPDETLVIERALQEHVDMDPPVTLQVLCDQCAFNPANVADADDRALRERLRGLVIKFLSSKYRASIARAVMKHETEAILLKGMVNTIPYATAHELRLIITDILLSLPSLSNGPSQNGSLILDSLLRATRMTLRIDRLDVEKLSSLLEQAVQVIKLRSPDARSIPTSRKRSYTTPAPPSSLVDAIPVLNLLADEAMMQHFPIELSSRTVECASIAYDSASTYGNKAVARTQFIAAAPAILTVLTRYISCKGCDRISHSCLKLLRTLRELIASSIESYSCRAPLTAALKALIVVLTNLSSKVEPTGSPSMAESREAQIYESSNEAKQVIELSRNLLKLVEGQSTTDEAPILRKQVADRLMKPVSQPRLTSETDQDNVTRKKSEGQTTVLNDDRKLMRGEQDDKLVQTRKRLRGGDGTTVNHQMSSSGNSPSLLSRLAPLSTTGPPISSRISNTRRPTSPTSTNATRTVSAGGDNLHSLSTGATRSTRAQDVSFPNMPASAGVGGSTPTTSSTSYSTTNGGKSERSATLSNRLRQKESRRTSVTEPMEISILGVAAQSVGVDEIRIKGAAERRNDSENEARAQASGELSLLARLSNSRGDAGGIRRDGRKRKRDWS